MCLLWPLSLPALAADLNLAAAWQNNATNANRDSDIVDALAFTADLSTSHRLALSRDDSLSLGGRLTAETWPRFSGLDRTAFAALATWQHKSGLGPQAPVFGATLTVEGTTARETARNALAAALTFTYRQRFGDATLLSASHEFSRLDARQSPFDRTGSESALTIARTLNDAWQLAVTARLRFGTVLSYATPPRPELVALARARMNVTTFDRAMVAYSLADARSLAGVIALTRTLGERSALSFAYEYRDTDKASLHYANHVVTCSLAHAF